MKKIIISLFMIIWGLCILAEQRVPGELLAYLNDDVRGLYLENFLGDYSLYDLQVDEIISQKSNLIVFSYNTNYIDDEELLNILNTDTRIKAVQFNYIFSDEDDNEDSTDSPDLPSVRYHRYHDVPVDDPYFGVQWALLNDGQSIPHNNSSSVSSQGTVGADSKIAEAWSILPSNDKEIVIAVLDSGFFTDHEDLTNTFLSGYNAVNPGSTIPPGSHGTAISGVIATDTNNTDGIAGAKGPNYNIKILPIYRGFEIQVKNLSRAFEYITNQRALYNETNGQQGLFIVAANMSFGKKADPNKYVEIKTGMDNMGQVGILSICSAGNVNDNIDIDGKQRVPASIASDYRITVTNTTKTDSIYSGEYGGGACYGLSTVHLGAPGTDIYVPYKNNKYGIQWGTSFSWQTSSSLGWD